MAPTCRASKPHMRISSRTPTPPLRAAAKVLKTAALKNKSPRLAAIAIKVQLDAFVRVKKAIDDMITQLLAEKKDEIKHKDFCADDPNMNQLKRAKQDREKSDLLAKVEDLTNLF